MAEQKVPAAPAVEKSEKKEKLIQVFCRLTGYKEEDVWSANPKTNVVSTGTGGKYQLGGNPTTVRTLMGPLPPKQRKAAAQAEEDEE